MSNRNDSNKPKDMREQLEVLMKLANHYRETGEDKLLYDIFDIVRRQKRAGNLDNASIKRMTDGFSRFLQPEQRKKLQALAEALMKE